MQNTKHATHKEAVRAAYGIIDSEGGTKTMNTGILYQQHQQAVARTIRAVIGPRKEDIEDLTSETFVRAMHALPRWRDQGLGPRPWLRRIARNLAVDFLRRQHAEMVPLPEPCNLSARDVIGPTLALRDVRQDIERLPTAQRQVMRLISQGYEVCDIVAMISIPRERVSVLKHRAIKTLRASAAS